MRRTSGEQKDLLIHEYSADLSADVRRLLGNDTWSVTPMADLLRAPLHPHSDRQHRPNKRKS
jgi:hypothetical protein